MYRRAARFEVRVDRSVGNRVLQKNLAAGAENSLLEEAGHRWQHNVLTHHDVLWVSAVPRQVAMKLLVLLANVVGVSSLGIAPHPAIA